MTLFPGLGTLGEANQIRRAEQKPHALKAKLERSKAKDKATREDETKLKAWADAVKQRDEWKDRYTGKPVKPAKAVGLLSRNSAHAHHVESRENEDVRYDVRNGLTLSFETHVKVEANELRIVGTKFFVVNKTRYIDCNAPVKFVVVK